MELHAVPRPLFVLDRHDPTLLRPASELEAVRQLAAHLGVPEPVRTKAPSADLWEGQEDEDELGGTYEEFDHLLYRLVDRREDPVRLVEDGFDEEFVRSTLQRVRRNQYKRRAPVIAKLSSRTIGPDFRLPRDAGMSRDRRLPPRG